jgi:tetratricopeptide (TPR) repeat protein
MTKLGRNDQCPCGSGKKYKRCCLPRNEAAAAELAAAAAAAATRALERMAPLEGREIDWDDDGLADASNRVVDLIHEGKLDEAEHAASALLTRYPDVHDGFERLGAVYEARGDRKVSAEWYRKALAFMQEHADGYDSKALDWMRRKIAQLERDS